MLPTQAAAAFASLETAEKLTPTQIEERARALRDQLSLDEKVSLMHGQLPLWPGLAAMTAPGGYSSQVWVAGAVPRLGIPGIRFSDGPRGVILEGATTFPVSMARGATWDAALEERVGDAIGRELRALGGNYFGGVCINLLRHPAWGRAQETYGEDPHQVGALGAALTRGVQRHLMACAKHFALNSMENARFKVDVTIGPRALHEVYLPHFKRVIEEGVASVMSAYNSLNGEWCGQNRELLTGILKEGWGFEGFVMTDFIFGMRDAKKAALAGQDVEMPFALLFARDLKGLVERGEVPLARVDDAVLRVLRQQVRFGQGRNPQDYRPEVAGCEALLRWDHPTRGRISPAEFIPVAEECGLIVEIGKWVLATACAEASHWERSLTIAVNLSPAQFASSKLLDDIAAVLSDTGLSPDRLELELTETTVMSDAAHAARIMTALKKLGVSIAMDDFGTGQSSLGNLRKFPFDKIKIDRSFISDQDADAETIVQTIIAMGRGLRLSVTAEGVETHRQMAMLRYHGCTFVQGYLLARPAPVGQLELNAGRQHWVQSGGASVTALPVKIAVAHSR